MIKVLIASSYNINRSFMFNFNFGEIKIIAIVIILIVVIIGLLIEIHNYKKINVKLSKQNKELIKRIKLLVGSSQDKSIITTMNNNYDYDSDDFEKNYAEQNKLYEEYKPLAQMIMKNLVDHAIILNIRTNMIHIRILLYASFSY